MESRCSFSSSVKYELSNAKEESMKREKGMGVLLDRIRGKNMITIRKKGVRTKSKGYKLDEMAKAKGWWWI